MASTDVNACLIIAAALLTSGVARAQQGDVAGEKQPDLPAEVVDMPAPALSAADELATFELPDGLVIELVASEPLVVDPVALTFDESGRMWVVEMRGYMPNIDGTGEDVPNGVVAVLSDADGDGRMDKRVEFLSGLVLPRAIALAGTGALVISPPDLLFCEDTDGDGVADLRTVIETGLSGIASPEHAINGLLYSHDNWYRCANRGVRYRYVERPSGRGDWEIGQTSGGGQWGICKDDFGRVFYNTNSDPFRGELYPGHYAIRNTNHGRAAGINLRLADDMRTWPARATPGVNRGYRGETLRDDFTLARFTGACGPLIYRGDALPNEYRGNAFVCEPTGNLIKRYAIQADGITLSAEAVQEGSEFLTSTDERFRPVNLYDGPDGGLYVVDLYRGILQHRIFMTSFLRKQVLARGLDQPVGLGRIWRIRAADQERSGFADAADASWAELVALLDSPNGFWRDTAQRLIVEEGRGEDKALALLRTSVREAGPLGRMHALWALAGLAGLDDGTLAVALQDDFAEVVCAALQLAEPKFARGVASFMTHAARLARHDDARVRLQAALSLGNARTPAAEWLMLEVLTRDSASSVVRGAVISGLREREAGFLELILADERWRADAPGRAQSIRALARCVARSGQGEALSKLLDTVLGLTPELAWQRTAMIAGMLAGRDKGPTGKYLGLALAREPNALNALEALEDESARELLAHLMWPGHNPLGAGQAVRALTKLERLYFEDGRTIYQQICAQCHQASGLGEPGKAPPLRQSESVLGDDERLIRVLLHGMGGPLVVNGTKWNQDMPAYAGGDEDIASVLTYLRREWGHGAEPVDPDQVQRIRAATKGRSKPWTADELSANAPTD